MPSTSLSRSSCRHRASCCRVPTFQLPRWRCTCC
uniref:Uncharacterized protein n=1 Tax=Arundo donax TaxID=35708 RepID=A0A0A9FRZ2_ARUDO